MANKLHNKPSFEKETVELAYEEAKKIQPLMSNWVDTIDTKIIGIFTVASLIAGLVPTFSDMDPVGWSLFFWIASVLFWAGTAVFTCIAFYPRTWRIDPDPRKVLGEDWLTLPAEPYRYYRLRDMGKTFERNRTESIKKADYLTLAIVFFALEIGSLALSLLFSAWIY